MAASRKKINLTIDERVIEKAKRLAEQRGASLSSLVEDFLRRLADDSAQSDSDWLSNFHRTYLGKKFKEPSDAEISKLREGLADKYR